MPNALWSGNGRGAKPEETISKDPAVGPKAVMASGPVEPKTRTVGLVRNASPTERGGQNLRGLCEPANERGGHEDRDALSRERCAGLGVKATHVKQGNDQAKRDNLALPGTNWQEPNTEELRHEKEHRGSQANATQKLRRDQAAIEA